jgi:DNA (cytosine-5)-methyltransferase 1
VMVSPAFAEWLMGWTPGWVTAVPGLTTEEQLKICGNGVVPQAAEAALRYLLSVDCGGAG